MNRNAPTKDACIFLRALTSGIIVKHIGLGHVSDDMANGAPYSHHACTPPFFLCDRDNAHAHTLTYACASNSTRTGIKKCGRVTSVLTHHDNLATAAAHSKNGDINVKTWTLSGAICLKKTLSRVSSRGQAGTL